MSVYEPNSRHLRDVLIFCFNMKKSVAEAYRMLLNMVRPLLVKKRVMNGFNASRTVILTSKTGIAVEERRFSKMQNWQNWRHYYWSKTRVKIKKTWHDHWE